MQTPPRESAATAAARLAAAAEALYASTGEDPNACTFVCISDTHCRQGAMPPLPRGDVLLHAGDFTMEGTLEEVQAFASWWHAQPHAQKVLIAGNHDRCLEGDSDGDDDEDGACARRSCGVRG